MFNNRRFLIGLGAGMVAGAVLLQLMLIGERRVGDPTQSVPLSKDNISERAEELGFKVYASDEVLYSKKEYDELAKQKEQLANELEAMKKTKAESIVQSQQSPPTEAESTERSASAQETTTPEKATLVIKPGMNAGSTAKALKELGIIDNADTFYNRIRTLKKQKFIRTGTYEIALSTPIDDIIQKITTRPAS